MLDYMGGDLAPDNWQGFNERRNCEQTVHKNVT